ncbi:PASTA domain-containing protein [Streptomyces sp. WAC08241]|uniref:PASTA domain-containing protein n=1 Tax=Streptomyces sp. WAC08241 TaxID=2487421 RepID=UPI000F7AC169|nr:PASTA domain-containing protein [Streptomyces sp. WAC08241]RSS42588.1 PASTA domain-containing protein [Streptomyces sp. WAC08241]
MKVTRHALTAAVTAAFAVVALSACSPESPSPEPTKTVTGVPTTVVPTQPTTAPATPTPTPTQEPTPEPTDPPATAELSEVPNVVGMNHAEAQNLLRSKGFMVNEEDAGPEGRMILNNHNWKVCRQDPAPGPSDALRVAIHSVKLSESC